MKITAVIFCILLVTRAFTSDQNNKIVQFDIGKILNARPVTTLTNNKLTTWTKGIDGGGSGDGYLTLSAALFNGNKQPHALPDDALFAANDSHPEIQLHYSNTDSLHNQTCNISGEGGVEFYIPQNKYRSLYFALTSAEGPSYLKVEFLYADDSTTFEDLVLPDYYDDLPTDHRKPELCYLAHDLAKWGNRNNMTEKDHHNIDLLTVHPDPTKKLKSINIQKKKPGYLVFWAATGEKAN
ncbi:hypothetical protein [Mucilaginibacter sp. OK098]|uniref:hypothetical protein n=1 Tax=Mucilaginibacter sp. OK098 TaxID=1855297 RepID=UPI00090F8042|nr:hypothetical protein [Mucilaginibacter sp. OK098]SHN08095.1 hypothetical protein SAMN05216524_10579 [Mucilaginibacter sp. OK098]